MWEGDSWTESLRGRGGRELDSAQRTRSQGVFLYKEARPGTPAIVSIISKTTDGETRCRDPPLHGLGSLLITAGGALIPQGRGNR